MGKRRRAKGAIQIETRGKGKILGLRWTYQSQEYRLSVGLPDTPTNRRAANAKAGKIQEDIALGHFDHSLEKYRDKEPEAPQTVKSDTVSLFTKFIVFRRQDGTSGQSIAAKYKPLLSNLKRFGCNIDDSGSACEFIELLRSRQSALIANQNLSLMKGFGQWCLTAGHWDANHFDEIAPLKGAKRRISNREPFAQQEVDLFMEAIKADPLRCHFSDFCYLIVSLGLRPSEAIGLRWKHFDLDKGMVTICESLSRGEDGRTSGYARQRKVTKTENTRTIPLTPSLVEILQRRRSPEDQLDDLVFLSKTGKPIDDHNFSQRVWKPVCKAAGITHRPPYVGRHTLISHGIESGWSLVQAAKIAGHSSTRQVAETYGHLINLPEMPEF